jgi:hypothetical protein
MHNQTFRSLPGSRTFDFVDGAASDLNIAEQVGKTVRARATPGRLNFYQRCMQQPLLIKIGTHYSHLAAAFKVNA